MIKDAQLLKKFEDTIMQKEGILSFSYSMRIFESLWNEGVKLGILPSKKPLEGIEVDIKIAQVLNSCLKKSSQG